MLCYWMEMNSYLQFRGDNVPRMSNDWTMVFRWFLFLYSPVGKWASISTHLVASKGILCRTFSRAVCYWSIAYVEPVAHIILDMHKGVKRVCKLPCWRVCYVATYKCSLDVRLASFPGLPRFSVLRFPLTIIHGYGRAAVYYCQRKPKNRKNGVGLGTRLM